MDETKEQKSDGTTTVRTRNDSRERTSSEIPVLSRSNSRADSKLDPQLQNLQSDTKDRGGTSRSESRERSRSEYSSRSKESPLQPTRTESHDRSLKTDSARKSDSKKAESKSSAKNSSPDKKSKQEHTKSTDIDKKSKAASSTDQKEPEYKEPIKVKISLSQIRSYNPIGAGDDSNDSDASFEETVDYERKRGKRKEGSSSKKKRYVLILLFIANMCIMFLICLPGWLSGECVGLMTWCRSM